MTLAVLLLSSMLGLAAAGPSRELTPEQRAMIFGKPGSVTGKKPVTRIRLKGTDDHGFYQCPYMQVKINGKGPFTFLFDTGSSYTFVRSNVIAAAGIPIEVERGGYHDLVRIRELKVGDLEIRDLVAVRDDDFGVDGVFGFKAFGDMNVVFRLAAREILVSPEPVPLEGSFVVPYELSHNIPVIPVRVGSAQIPTLIDTGDDAYAWEVRTEDLHGAVTAHVPVPAQVVLNGANPSSTSVTTLDSAVHLGPVTIEHAVVGINDALPVPDFGVDYLDDFNIAFDPKRMTVTFQPLSPGSGTQLRGNPTAGFTLKFDGKGTVNAVVPGSAAEQLGMKSGDAVLAVDGQSIHKYDPRAWDRALATGKPLTIRWLQGGKERTDPLEVKELR